MANTTLPLQVKKAIDNALVASVYRELAVAVNTSLIRRPGEAYQPRAIQAASAEVNYEEGDHEARTLRHPPRR